MGSVLRFSRFSFVLLMLVLAAISAGKDGARVEGRRLVEVGLDDYPSPAANSGHQPKPNPNPRPTLSSDDVVNGSGKDSRPKHHFK